MIKVDPTYAIPMVVSGAIAGVAAYIIGEKRCKKEYISGYECGDTCFLHNLSEAGLKATPILEEAIHDIDPTGKTHVDTADVRKRIIDEFASVDPGFREFYTDILDAVISARKKDEVGA